MTNAERKWIAGLHRKKERMASGCFLVEGVKSVEDLLASDFEVERLVATEGWEVPAGCGFRVARVSVSEMEGISGLETPQPVLAVVRMPAEAEWSGGRGRWLGLDGIQDPGNLGTLLRLADWFGLEGVVCSRDCVERFNPKVVQASMGSVFRVRVVVGDLPELLGGLPAGVWCAGAFLEGESVYEAELPPEGVLVLGNEGRGIRPETAAVLGCRLTIPGRGGAESLNVAMAGAVFCSEWTRSGTAKGRG